MKVVYNNCYGGFGLSEEAEKLYMKYSGKENLTWSDFLCIPRHDPILVRVVEELKDSSGICADLDIEEIPDGTPYIIDEYDGLERVVTSIDWIIP